MGVHSGKFGVLNGRSTVRNWAINEESTNPKFVASNTRGGSGRRNGINSWSGSLATYGHAPGIMPKDIAAFLGYTGPDSDILAGTGPRATGNIICDSLALNWNWTNGEILNAVANFSGHLGLGWTMAGAAITDVTVPDVPEVTGTLFEYSANGTDWFEITDLVSAALTIIAENQSYVNSSTGGETGRKAGNIDWTLALVQQNLDRGVTLGFDKGDDIQIRGYVDAVDFWLLKWGKVKNFTNLTVDIETGAIMQRTVNIEMNGFVGGVVGGITLPGAGSPWWS